MNITGQPGKVAGRGDHLKMWEYNMQKPWENLKKWSDKFPDVFGFKVEKPQVCRSQPLHPTQGLRSLDTSGITSSKSRGGTPKLDAIELYILSLWLIEMHFCPTKTTLPFWHSSSPPSKTGSNLQGQGGLVSSAEALWKSRHQARCPLLPGNGFHGRMLLLLLSHEAMGST